MKRGTQEHPKMLMLQAKLGLTKWQAVGLLESLWAWTARYAIQGDVGKWPDEVIALGIDWRDAPDRLIKALVTSRWLDRVDGAARLVIHDLADHADNTWRQCLVDAGLTWWDGSSVRKTQRGRPTRVSNTSPGILQRNSSKTTKEFQNNSILTPQPEPEPEPQPEPEPEPQPEPEPSSSSSSDHSVISSSNAERARTDNRKKRRKSKDLDDDDQKPSERSQTEPTGEIQYATPRDELTALIHATTGSQPDGKLVREISETLELRGVNLPDYLMDIEPRIERLHRRAGPGFFLAHAQQFQTNTRPAPEPKVLPPEDESEKCPKCGCEPGKGLILVDERWENCPECNSVASRVQEVPDAGAETETPVVTER